MLYDVKSQSASAAALVFCLSSHTRHVATLSEHFTYQNKAVSLKTGYYRRWPAIMEADYLMAKQQLLTHKGYLCKETLYIYK